MRDSGIREWNVRKVRIMRNAGMWCGKDLASTCVLRPRLGISCPYFGNAEFNDIDEEEIVADNN